MLKLSNNFAYILTGIVLAIASTVYAASVSVPQATQKGDFVGGLATGNYQLIHPCSNGLVLAASSTSSTGWECASTSGSSGLTSFAGMSGPAITISTSSDTNILLNIITGGNNATLTPVWTGTLAAGRLNSNVVQSISTTTSGNLFNASISAQNLALSYPVNVINSVSTTSNSTVFNVSTSTTGSTNSLVINFPNNLLTAVSADAPLGGNGTSGSHLTCSGCLTANQSITVNGVVSGSGATTITTAFNSTTPISFGGTGTTTGPTATGQILASNGTGWGVAKFINGANVTITTSTPGQIIIASTDQFQGTVTSVSGSGGTTGLTLTGGAITNSGTLTIGGILVPANGGTGTSTAPAQTGQFLAADGTGTLYAPTKFVNGANITITTSTPGSLTIACSSCLTANQSITLSGVVSGSGQTSITTAFNSTTPIAFGGTATTTAPTQAGQILASTGSTWGVSRFINGANITISTSTVGQITIASADQFVGTVTSVSGSGGTTGLTLTGGAITTSGTLTLGGTLIVANGGTGAASLTANDILFGAGTGVVATSSNFTFTTGSNTLAVTGTTTVSSNLFVGATSTINTPFATSTLLGIQGNINNFIEANIQNRSSAATSSSSWVMTADNGSNSMRYSEIFQNSSGFIKTSASTGGAGDAGLLSSDASLIIAAASTTNTSALINFAVQGVNIATGTKTSFQMINASTSALTLSGLTSQNCIGTSAAGLLQAGTCSGTGNAAWTIGNGFIFNATSTDSILMGTSTASTSSELFLQASSSKSNFITAASSTGTTTFKVDTAGSVYTLGGSSNAGYLFLTATPSDYGMTQTGSNLILKAGGNSVLTLTSTQLQARVGGSVSAPEYSFAVDSGTGMHDSSNVLTLSTNGAGRMTFDAAGNAGMNSSTPTANLVVEGISGATPILTVASSSNVSYLTVSSIGAVSLSNTLSVTNTTTMGTALIIPAAAASILGTSGQISINTTAGTLSYRDSTAQRYLNPEVCSHPVWTVESETSGRREKLDIFNATSTLTKFKVSLYQPSDTITFNAYYQSDYNAATSTTGKIFSTDQTVTTSSTTVLTTFASSTPGTNQHLILTVGNASSTGASFQWCWRENQ